MVKVYSIDGVTPVVDPSAYVHPTAVLIGDVIIGPDCYIGPCASIRADFGQFTMGRGSNFQDNCTSHSCAGGDVHMGEYCNIGHGAVLHGCVLHDRVLVGMNAVIMDGAEIHDYTLVAALSFVPAAMELPSKTNSSRLGKLGKSLSDSSLLPVRFNFLRAFMLSIPLREVSVSFS